MRYLLTIRCDVDAIDDLHARDICNEFIDTLDVDNKIKELARRTLKSMKISSYKLQEIRDNEQPRGVIL